MLDDAVLAGGIHRLENREHRPAVLRVKHVLQVGELLDAVLQHLLGLALVDREACGIAGIGIRQPELFGIVDAVFAGEGFDLHGATSRRRGAFDKSVQAGALRKKVWIKPGIIGSMSAAPRAT